MDSDMKLWLPAFYPTNPNCNFIINLQSWVPISGNSSDDKDVKKDYSSLPPQITLINAPGPSKSNGTIQIIVDPRSNWHYLDNTNVTVNVQAYFFDSQTSRTIFSGIMKILIFFMTPQTLPNYMKFPVFLPQFAPNTTTIF
jgi:hypothetical protein